MAKDPRLAAATVKWMATTVKGLTRKVAKLAAKAENNKDCVKACREVFGKYCSYTRS